MKYGLKTEDFDFLFTNLIQPLKNMGAQVYLFGSRATGKYQVFSDIDLLFLAPTDKNISQATISQLMLALEDSTFVYKVDLVNYSQLATSYKKTVDREKIEL